MQYYLVRFSAFIAIILLIAGVSLMVACTYDDDDDDDNATPTSTPTLTPTQPPGPTSTPSQTPTVQPDPTTTPTSTPTPTPPPDATPTPTRPPEGTQVGNYATNFTLNDRKEIPHSLGQYEGRVILLDFSAMWCGPCQMEAAKAEALYQHYRDRGFIVITVLIADYSNSNADAVDCSLWVDKYGLTFPVLYDEFRHVWNKYNDNGSIPLNLVIDRNHVIRYKSPGFNEAAIVAWIEQLL